MNFQQNRKAYFLMTGLLLLASLLSYGGNSSHELLQWDDVAYVSSNDWVTNPSWEGLIALFTEHRVFNWHPLTWLSYIPEYAVCEDNAVCYKSTNILLHTINALLVFGLTGAVLKLLANNSGNTNTDSRLIFVASMVAAILFAIHPQHVESVIWVAERKDLLCAAFYLAALISYLLYHAAERGLLRLLPFAFFILACMSKPMAISLPAVLVLLDVFLLNRIELSVRALNSETVSHSFKIVIVEKIHFYLVMIGMMAITLLAQSSEGVELSAQESKLAVIAGALQHYVSAFFYPLNLSPFYPVEISSSVSIADYWPLGLMFVSVLLSLYFSKRKRSILLLVGCYLVTITPVVGVVTIGDHAFADRYSYLPTIGFYIFTAYWAARGILRSELATKVGSAGMCAIAILFVTTTHQYKNTWQNDLTLWQFVDARYPDTSIIVANNLGIAHFSRGDYESAKANFQSAIEIDPARPRAYANLASAYQALGDSQASLQTYTAGVSNNPDNIGLKVSASFAFLNSNQDERAFEYLTQALNQDDEFAPALLGLGSLLFKNGDLDGAISSLQRIPKGSEVDYDARLLLVRAMAYSDKTQAKELLKQLRSDYPQAASIDDVNDWIDQL